MQIPAAALLLLHYTRPLGDGLWSVSTVLYEVVYTQIKTGVRQMCCIDCKQLLMARTEKKGPAEPKKIAPRAKMALALLFKFLCIDQSEVRYLL